MIRTALAAVAALALLGSTPAFACPNEKDCPMHKDKVAAAEKKDAAEATSCKCGAASPKDCRCGGKCDCDHHRKAGKKAEKKAEKKS